MLDRLRRLLPGKAAGTRRSADAKTPAPSLYDDARAQGNALVQEGRFAEAETHYRHALEQRPGDVKTLGSLGFALKEKGQLEEARTCLQQAIALDADGFFAVDNHYLCGLIAEEATDIHAAKEHLTAALALKPDFELACRDLCRLLYLAGDLKNAQEVLEKGMRLHPEYGDFHFYQGNLLFEKNSLELAVQSYKRALTLGSLYADVYCALGTAHYRLGNKTLAVENFELARRLDPHTGALAKYESGFHCFRLADHASAVKDLEQSVLLDPHFLRAHSTLIFCLNLLPELASTYRSSIARYASIVTSKAHPNPHPCWRLDPPARRPLRIGFVSADFRTHPVGFFMEGILREIDHRRFGLVAYSNNASNDQITARLQGSFEEWRVVRNLTDEKVAQIISDDQIDILVDLGGHTSDNRLPVFAWRPAPVQATWLGYFASTGVTEIDYILADEHCVPLQSKEFFSEKVWRLPDTRLCMTPPVTRQPVPVSRPPALANGYVTFGSFQARTKITPAVLSLWARILSALPGSRLRLQIPTTDIAAIRNEFLSQLDAAGLDPLRVSLTGSTQWEDYLSSYQHVDIVLDTFPYPGGTTTAEALWMGVPTLTMAGDTMLSRQGSGMLGCVGLDAWIADSEEAYVAKAVLFASDLSALTDLREELRGRAVRSPLFDARRFAENLQTALEAMYQERRATIMTGGSLADRAQGWGSASSMGEKC
jgi:predicted O-linked N-acetylglucosamine transferase (SPINDLY family)